MISLTILDWQQRTIRIAFLTIALQRNAGSSRLSKWPDFGKKVRPEAGRCFFRNRLGSTSSSPHLVSMEDEPSVDDDGLAGHGLGAAHGDDHVGAVVLVGGLLSSELGAERSICSDRKLAVSEASAPSGW